MMQRIDMILNVLLNILLVLGFIRVQNPALDAILLVLFVTRNLDGQFHSFLEALQIPFIL